MPGANMARPKTNEPRVSWATPLITWPLVQPPAIIAAINSDAPTAKAYIMRLGVESPNYSRHIIGNDGSPRFRPRFVLNEARPPPNMPNTTIQP